MVSSSYSGKIERPVPGGGGGGVWGKQTFSKLERNPPDEKKSNAEGGGFSREETGNTSKHARKRKRKASGLLERDAEKT